MSTKRKRISKKQLKAMRDSIVDEVDAMVALATDPMTLKKARAFIVELEDELKHVLKLKLMVIDDGEVD